MRSTRRASRPLRAGDAGGRPRCAPCRSGRTDRGDAGSAFEQPADTPSGKHSSPANSRIAAVPPVAPTLEALKHGDPGPGAATREFAFQPDAGHWQQEVMRLARRLARGEPDPFAALEP